jgi:hypothetical protein
MRRIRHYAILRGSGRGHGYVWLSISVPLTVEGDTTVTTIFGSVNPHTPEETHPRAIATWSRQADGLLCPSWG